MMVGEEYKASLFDGRTTYFEGERVEDLPGHPLLGIAVGHAAAGYDWMAGHAVDAKGDRSRPPGKQDDPSAYVRVVDRQADVVVIRGLQVAGLGNGAAH